MGRVRDRSIIAAAAALALFLAPGLLAAQADPPVRPEWAVSARSLAHPLALPSPGAETTADPAFLGPVLAGRTVAALGESGHGMSEPASVKARLVRYLHEALGYDVIAFESSLFECWAADRRAAEEDAETTLRDALFGVWHSREVLELFQYIRATKATSRPLVLAGFDVQISSARGAARRPRILREAIAPLDPVYAAEVESRDAQFVARHDESEWRTAHAAAFRTFYANLAWWAAARAPELEAAHPEAPELPAVLRQTARSMVSFIDEMESGGAARTDAREAGMADNVLALAREVYPGRKVLLWGHNAHFSRDSGGPELGSARPMGARLGRAMGSEYYAVGLFAGRGEACWNDRTPYLLTPPKDDGLEAVLLAAGRPALFVEMAGAAPVAWNAWMSSLLPAKSWGYWDTEIVPRRRFDGLIFLRDVSRPDYLDIEPPGGRESPAPLDLALD
jgi:erythromycin esterase